MKRGGSARFLGIVILWIAILGAIGVVVTKFPEVRTWLNSNETVADTLEVPFIFWGGDVATFYANGGLQTKADTIFDKQGLKIKLTRVDNFDQQVKSYLAGKSKFLRGTFSMLGQASEKVSHDPGAQPVVFLQLTWSAGDHLVARSNCKTLADLKGKRVALQRAGPHVGMLGDILHTAELTWEDITKVWTDDVTGDNGPAAKFRSDASVDACFVITPDMIAVTGGTTKEPKTGTGVDGTVKDAHVLVSTFDMKRSIADVYACRKDFFDAHREWVEKFAAGYLKACEELMAIKNLATDRDKNETVRYAEILKMTRQIFGKDLASDDDADGLISDAVFVRLSGNRTFFTENSPSNFEGKQKAALDLAIAMGDAKEKREFLKPGFDYERLAKLGSLTSDLRAVPRSMPKDFQLPDNNATLFSFEIHFSNGQTKFDVAKYGADFQRAADQASLFGRAPIAVRGHADLSGVLTEFLRAGLEKNLLKKDEGRYLLQPSGTVLDLANTAKIEELVSSGEFETPEHNPRELLGKLRKLSLDRAEEVRTALLDYARSKNYSMDENQLRPVGVGIHEPLVRMPRTEAEFERNRRVEFRLLKLAIQESPDKGNPVDY